MSIVMMHILIAYDDHFGINVAVQAYRLEVLLETYILEIN